MPLKIIRKYFLPIFLIVLVGVIYLHNLSWSVFGGDVGDLVSASVVGGVAHPPGYPLFTLIGFLLTRINLFTPAFLVGLISVFASTFAVLIYYYFVLENAKNKIIAVISSLILAFNYFFWFYSEIAEVFALNNLFVITLFFIAFLNFKYKKEKYLFLLSFLGGLSLTHHHTILLIFPSLLILVYPQLFLFLKNPKKILLLSAFFILGFTPYIYVFLASAQNPPINWDNVHDLNSFLHLFLRKDYGTFSAGLYAPSVLEQKVVILNNFIFKLISQLTTPVIILCILGMIKLVKINKKIFTAILLAFLISGPFFIAYASFPLLNSFFIGTSERFFILPAVIFLFFLPFGFVYAMELFAKLGIRKKFINIILAVFFIIPIMLFVYNFSKTDLHNVWNGDNLAYNILSPLPKNSVLFLGGDTVLFNSWYAYYGLRFRNDIQLLDGNGLAKDQYFKNELAKYLKNNPKEKNNKDLYANVIAEISQKRPVISVIKFQRSKGEKLIWMPFGLTYRLINSSKNIPTKEEFVINSSKIWRNFKLNDVNNKSSRSLILSDINSIYSGSLITLGNYIINTYKDYDLAYSFYKKAQLVEKDDNRVYQSLGIYYSLKSNCKNAESNLIKSLELYPFDKYSYSLLYVIYKDCFKDNNRANEVLQRYGKIYGSDLLKDLATLNTE